MKYLFYLILIILFISCSDHDKKTNVLVINGELKSSTSGYIFIEKLVSEGYEKMDSTKMKDGISFLFHVPKGKMEIYRINFFGFQECILVLDSSDVSVVAEGNLRKAKFLFSGSPEVELLSQVNERASNYELEKKMYNHKFLNLTNQEDSLEIADLRNNNSKRELEYHDYLKQSIDSLNGNLAAWLILSEHINIEQNLDFYEDQIKLFQKSIPDSWQFKVLNEKFNSVKKLSIGSIAPDFSLPTPDGEIIQQASFRGKYLFLDFWASWCQPCRAENPDLVKVYNKYKGEHFEILGISFDKKRENWIKAIKQDGLEWVHVSDLKYFDSELIQLYNIVNVPTTILLDPQGKIIAKNIHSHELDLILKKKLK